MSTSTAAELDQLQTDLSSGGVEAVLQRLADQLRDKKQYHELFEALKMQVRQRAGLPVTYSDSGDELEPQQRDQLEDGLVEACREVGLLLLADGKIREGWMYMRPVGDKTAVAEMLQKTEVHDDNMDELVEVALTEGVDVRLGFGLVLENYGTCNSITTYESQMYNRSLADQQVAAEMLVEHLHKELLASLKADIGQQEGAEPSENLLRDLVADREWLFQEHSYHIDTTHLASTVRFARVIDSEKHLRLALDLTEYGRRLSSQFQYQGEEPFADVYASHLLFFQAALGENADEAVKYFREKAETVDVHEIGTAAIEVYIDLLARLGRHEEAIEATINMMPEDGQPIGIAPSLLELSQQAGNFEPMMNYYRQREDLLGYATGLVHANKT